VLNISSPEAADVTAIGAFFIDLMPSCAFANVAPEKIDAASKTAAHGIEIFIIDLPFVFTLTQRLKRLRGALPNKSLNRTPNTQQTYTGYLDMRL
jgi:hypothetical protein